MNYDDLKKQYGQQFCFAPHQGDLFFYKKIEWHLKNIETHCKDCMERDVFRDIEESIIYLNKANSNALRCIKELIAALDCPYPEQRYADTYRAVMRLFLLFGKGDLFEWC